MIELRTVTLAEAEKLVAAQVAEMQVRYDDDSTSPIDAEEFLPPGGVFLVASLHGVDVGCGGLRPLRTGIGEIKRMYAAPSVRGQGVGRAVLRGLVDHARSMGLEAVWLETGVRQPEAMGLYASEGFAPIPPYGYYKDHPESRCFAITL